MDGTGYVYCDGTGGVPLISFDNGQKGNGFREVIMTYPVFQTDKGTVVDFKNGLGYHQKNWFMALPAEQKSKLMRRKY